MLQAAPLSPFLSQLQTKCLDRRQIATNRKQKEFAKGKRTDSFHLSLPICAVQFVKGSSCMSHPHLTWSLWGCRRNLLLWPYFCKVKYLALILKLFIPSLHFLDCFYFAFANQSLHNINQIKQFDYHMPLFLSRNFSAQFLPLEGSI